MHYNLTMLYYLIIYYFCLCFMLIKFTSFQYSISINLLKSFFEREDKHCFYHIQTMSQQTKIESQIVESQADKIVKQYTIIKNAQPISLQQVPMILKLAVMFCTTTACQAINSTSFIRKLSQPSQMIRKMDLSLKRQMYFSMLRYNTIVFGSKLYFDSVYQNQIQLAKENKYFGIYYKIGALTGLATYFINTILDHVAQVRQKYNFFYNPLVGNNSKINAKYILELSKQLVSSKNIKSTLNKITFLGILGTTIYRCIYFGIYEKIRRQFQHPINEYLIAPVLCTTFSLVTLPLDNIRFYQMKQKKSILNIIDQKGFSLLQVHKNKIIGSLFRQSLAISLFMMGQKSLLYSYRLAMD